MDFDRSLLWPLDNILSHMFQIYNFSYRLVLILIFPCHLCLERQSALSLSSFFFWGGGRASCLSTIIAKAYPTGLICATSPPVWIILSACLPVRPLSCFSFHPSSVHPLKGPSARRTFIRLSNHLSFHPSISPSTHPPVCLSTHSHPYVHIPGTKTNTFIFRYLPSLWCVSCIIVIVVDILSSTFLYHEISFFL